MSNGRKIKLGKGVSLEGASLNYEEQMGPIELKVKQKLKEKPEIKVGRRLNIKGTNIDIGARKQGKDISGGFMIKIPFKKGGKVGNRT